MGQVWCLIVLIPDLCPLSYFINSALEFKIIAGCYFLIYISGQLQVQFLSSAIGYPIHQHFGKDVPVIDKENVETQPFETKDVHAESIHILWVCVSERTRQKPSKGVYHIVPVLKR